MKSLLITSALAAAFKAGVDHAVSLILYPDSLPVEMVRDVRCWDWGFTYLLDGTVQCAVRMVPRHDGTVSYEDHVDAGLDERGELVSVHGFTLHPDLESLIAGALVGYVGDGDRLADDVREAVSQDLVALNRGDYLPSL